MPLPLVHSGDIYAVVVGVCLGFDIIDTCCPHKLFTHVASERPPKLSVKPLHKFANYATLASKCPHYTFIALATYSRLEKTNYVSYAEKATSNTINKVNVSYL